MSIKWQAKNTSEAILPIRLATWLFGLGIIHFPLNNPRFRLTIVYFIVMIVGYSISVYYVSPYSQKIELLSIQQIFLLIIFYVNIFIYMSNIILSWYWKNLSQLTESKMNKIDETLGKLGVPIDYPSIFHESVKVIVLWCTLVLVVNSVNVSAIHKMFDLRTCIFLIFVYNHPVYANSVPSMQFYISIGIMEQRFRKVNEVLSDIVLWELNGRRIDENWKWPPTPMSITVKNQTLHRLSTHQDDTKEILRIAKHIHLELSLLCQNILRIHGIQIAMALASSLIVATSFICGFYVLQFGSKSWDNYRLPLLSVRLGYLSMKVFFINNCCARTMFEWEKTGQIIHELETISKNSVYHDEIRYFSLQMTQNPMSFTACGFVTLGYRFLIGFIGSVTTYVIILVQLYGTPTE